MLNILFDIVNVKPSATYIAPLVALLFSIVKFSIVNCPVFKKKIALPFTALFFLNVEPLIETVEEVFIYTIPDPLAMFSSKVESSIINCASTTLIAAPWEFSPVTLFELNPVDLIVKSFSVYIAPPDTVAVLFVNVNPSAENVEPTL